jgi:hypothetical protein
LLRFARNDGPSVWEGQSQKTEPKNASPTGILFYAEAENSNFEKPVGSVNKIPEKICVVFSWRAE